MDDRATCRSTATTSMSAGTRNMSCGSLFPFWRHGQPSISQSFMAFPYFYKKLQKIVQLCTVVEPLHLYLSCRNNGSEWQSQGIGRNTKDRRLSRSNPSTNCHSVQKQEDAKLRLRKGARLVQTELVLRVCICEGLLLNGLLVPKATAAWSPPGADPTSSTPQSATGTILHTHRLPGI